MPSRAPIVPGPPVPPGADVGLFGGSFDPIHRGHVAPVRAAREALGLDRVVYLPTALPPHKPKRDFAPAHARWAMVELALLDEEGLYASAFELTLGRPAYTVETVEAFQEAHPGVRFHLVIGGDSLAEITTWRRWEDLVARVPLVVLVRPGWALDEVRASLPPGLAARAGGPGAARFVTDAAVDLSSTALRAAIGRGELPPPGDLPGQVLDYVEKYRLYR